MVFFFSASKVQTCTSRMSSDGLEAQTEAISNFERSFLARMCVRVCGRNIFESGHTRLINLLLNANALVSDCGALEEEKSARDRSARLALPIKNHSENCIFFAVSISLAALLFCFRFQVAFKVGHHKALHLRLLHANDTLLCALLLLPTRLFSVLPLQFS